MNKLPKSKVRSVGVANFDVEQLETLIKATGIAPAVNQVERHPRLQILDLVKYSAEKNIHITAYSAFGNNSEGLPLLVAVDEVKAVADRLTKAQSKTVTPAQVILAWSQIGGHSVIPKSVKASRILENFQEVKLDAEAVADLNKMGTPPKRFNVPVFCTSPSLLPCVFIVVGPEADHLQTSRRGISTSLARMSRRRPRTRSSCPRIPRAGLCSKGTAPRRSGIRDQQYI